MKKNITLGVIAIFVVFFVLITINKINYNLNEKKDENFYKYTEIKNRKRNLVNNDINDINDVEVYSDKIIYDKNLLINYNYFCEDQSITGKIFIDNNNYLYITSINENRIKKVSTEKFKTMYVKDYEYEGIYVYLISKDDKLYILSLENNNIDEVKIEEISLNYKVKNFVDIEFKHDMFVPGNTLFILCDNDKIYDIGSATRYSEDVVSIFNSIYVYDDKTMSNVYGQMLEDKGENYYKIKYVFFTITDSNIVDKEKVVIITEDDKFLYVDNDLIYVYEFSEKVDSIKFDTNYPYVDGNLHISFKNGYNVDLVARCSEYYCVNEFAE